jgi:outer membrane protein insertion porin family
MRRALLPLAIGLLIFFASAGLRAQAPAPAQNLPAKGPASSKIEAITVSGTKKISTDQIASASGLKAGDVVTVEQIKAAADRLAALGLFSAVNYRYSAKGDAIALEFQVTEAPTYPLSFDNFPWFSDVEIGDAIRSSVGLFTGESPGDGAMVDQIAEVLEKLLASKKIKGAVTHQLLAQAVGDGMMMQFSLDGSPLKIQSVQFGDVLATNSDRLKDRLSDLKGQPYSRFAIELFENEHVRPLYSSKGFLRARVGPPVAHLNSDAVNPAGPGVDISIPITPGAAYTWKGISWQGNTAFPSSILDGTIQMKSGDVADGMKIENDWQDIQAEYGRHGYLDMKWKAQEQFDDAAHQVSYQVVIVEGAQYRMGEMVITGLSTEAEKRLRRNWQIAAGDIFNNGYYEGLAKELVKPNESVFGELPVHYETFGHWLQPDAEKHTVQVLFDFK